MTAPRIPRHRGSVDAQAVLGYLLAVVIAILATLALVHWMACSQAESVALCGMLVTPLRTSRWPWARRLAYWLRAAVEREALRREEGALDNMEAVLQSLPDEIRLQRIRIDVLRIRLIDTEAVARGEG